MCEITRRNFEEKFNEIVGNLKSASFISIDCEFTGLYVGTNKCSLFDTAEARFNKLQKSFNGVLIVQLGLSTFKFERDSSTYTVSTYTFYLMPMALSSNETFLCQTKSIEFLCKHKFDFNKLFYDGISYINESKEAECMRNIMEGNLLDGEKLQDIQHYCSIIAKWSNGVGYGSEMVLELKETDTFVYMLHEEIRKRFINIWTFIKEPNIVRIRKVREPEKLQFSSDPKETSQLKKKLLDSMLGFSRIMSVLKTLKKPIIGHNLLPDLVLIYKQFYNPTPVSYTDFKKNITKIFPHVYDTKRMSFELRNSLSREQCWHSNSLSDLYCYLNNGKGVNVILFSPKVNHTNEEYLKEKSFHDAGFDSYCTGFCFLKMAHMFFHWDKNSKTFSSLKKPLFSSWFLSGIKSTKNQVNLARAQVKYIALDRNDPKSSRPGLLFVKSKTGQALDFTKVTEAIGKYATLDAQRIGKFRGLMAVGNDKQAQIILDYFKGSKEIEVTKYKFLKHSASGRIIIPTTIIAVVMLFTLGASLGWRRMLNFT